MEFTFRPGVPGDIDAVTALYEAAIDRLDATTNYPGWQQGLYPTQRTAEDALSEGCLYVAEQEGTLLGSMVLRHEPLEPYAEGRWLSALDYQDILVIYTFAVHPAAQGLGVGHAMLQSAADFGVRSGGEPFHRLCHFLNGEIPQFGENSVGVRRRR